MSHGYTSRISTGLQQRQSMTPKAENEVDTIKPRNQKLYETSTSRRIFSASSLKNLNKQILSTNASEAVAVQTSPAESISN